MIYKVCSIFDSKVEAFMQPFFVPARGAALRMFADLVEDSQTAVSKHPADFTLFELGSYDDSNAKFDMYATPVSLCLAVEFVKS